MANIAMTKNTAPMTGPIFPMAAKTFGSATNISPGQALMPSVPVNTKIAGIIMAPASSAIDVSKISI